MEEEWLSVLPKYSLEDSDDKPPTLAPDERLDRMPVPVDRAPSDEYFVAAARKKLEIVIDVHDRWSKRAKNRSSRYFNVQARIQRFFVKVLEDFDDIFGPTETSEVVYRKKICRSEKRNK